MRDKIQKDNDNKKLLFRLETELSKLMTPMLFKKAGAQKEIDDYQHYGIGHLNTCAEFAGLFY